MWRKELFSNRSQHFDKRSWSCHLNILQRLALSHTNILQNHISVYNTFKIPTIETDQYELPCLYWIPKLHKNISRSSKCSIKPLLLLLTKIMTVVKKQLQTYCATTYARSGVNQNFEILKIFYRTSIKFGISKPFLYHQR